MRLIESLATAFRFFPDPGGQHAEATAPLDPITFAACMAPLGPFEQKPFLTVAVSGGPDSLALTLLANDWARKRGGRVVGLTVDHGLRTASTDEALQTGRWLAAEAIEHHRLPWLGDKPSSGLQRHARDARYDLLADWCRRHGCLHLLTAHHREDQAETVAIRKTRKSGAAGLAGMASIREIKGLRLLRPLLGIEKARLSMSLEAAAQPWIEDPSNASPAFTRNRLRQSGLDVDALIDEAKRQGAFRREQDERVASALIRLVVLDPAGFATLDKTGFERLETALAKDLLTRLLITIGGRPYPPRSQSLERLLSAMRAATPVASTLAHCRILPHRGRWLICPEKPSDTMLPLEPGRLQRWDDRFTMRLTAPLRGLHVSSLGETGEHARNTLMENENFRWLPGVVRRSLPAVFDGSELIAVPHLGLFQPALSADSLNVRFCPHTPLANASFMPHILPLGRERSIVLLQR